MTTLYETLGVERNATEKEIKTAYRKKAAKHHPDREGGDNDEFVKVQAAYDILSDPEKRKEYDETGSTDQKKGLPSAHTVIFQVINRCLEEMDEPEYDNLVGLIKKHFKSEAKMMKNSLDEFNKDRKKLLKVKKRIKNGGFLLQVINTARREDVKRYLIFRQARVMLRECNEIVKDWEYISDERKGPKLVKPRELDFEALLREIRMK